MMTSVRTMTAALACGLAFTVGASAADTASVALKDPNGKSVGSVEMRQVKTGVLLHAKFENLPEGTHAFHVHAIGECVPPFTSAGGHYNPTGEKHGLEAEDGPHAGDMPNIHIPANGVLEIEVLNTFIALDDQLFDADGAAIVLHEGADDYVTDPAGAAGPRIACGVIER